MKIGIDGRFYGPKHAGLGRYTKNLIDQLAKIDRQNDYVVFLHTSNAAEFVTDNLHFSTEIVSTAHYSVKEQLSLPNLLRKHHFDLVHFPHLNVPVGYRQPYVVTIHDLIMHTFKNRAATTRHSVVYEAKHMAYRAVTRNAALRARKVIVPSQAVKKEIVDFYHLPEERIAVTYEAADDLVYDTVTKQQADRVLDKYGLSRPFVMYVGNVYPHKNIELLIKSLKQLHQQCGVKLILPSARSVFLQRTEDMLEQYGVRDLAILPGFVPDEDLQVLYSQALAYVFPTLSEGFGLPALEAMTAGAPVICSDIPVLREICADAAVYFDPHDSESLIKAVDRLHSNPPARLELIAKGYQRAKQFSWRTMAEQTLVVYEKVGGQRS